MRVLVRDPATASRDGKHPVFGDAEDALSGNVSRVFLTGVPQSVPTTDCRQPDGWSCGPYSLAECLGQGDGEDARQWLINRGLITSQHGTDYDGIVGYLNSCGYSCEYDGRAHDGEREGAIFDRIIGHLRAGYKVILCMHGTRKGCRTDYWTKSGHYICVYGIEEEGEDEDKMIIDVMKKVRVDKIYKTPKVKLVKVNEGSTLNVRLAPDAKAPNNPVWPKLARGNAVKELGKANNGWSLISIWAGDGTGSIGYVKSSYLATKL